MIYEVKMRRSILSMLLICSSVSLAHSSVFRGLYVPVLSAVNSVHKIVKVVDGYHFSLSATAGVLERTLKHGDGYIESLSVTKDGLLKVRTGVHVDVKTPQQLVRNNFFNPDEFRIGVTADRKILLLADNGSVALLGEFKLNNNNLELIINEFTDTKIYRADVGVIKSAQTFKINEFSSNDFVVKNGYFVDLETYERRLIPLQIRKIIEDFLDI